MPRSAEMPRQTSEVRALGRRPRRRRAGHPGHRDPRTRRPRAPRPL